MDQLSRRSSSAGWLGQSTFAKAALRRPERLIPNPKLRLREQMHEVARYRQLSIRTEDSYWQWIRRYILFQGKRHPREMGSAEVRRFLSHLATERKVAPATQCQALNLG